MQDLLNRINIPGFDANGYISSHRNNASALPNIGIAASGGGYRALLNGAGALAAFDSRTDNSTTSGQLGGLLQSATYLAGLSGGGWLVGSLYANNFSSVQSIQRDNGEPWDFVNSIFEGPETGKGFLSQADYYKNIADTVSSKDDALNFETTVTDYWGRALSYQLVNAPMGGPDMTFSSIAKQDFFTNGEAPLPILVADGRAPGTIIVSANTTEYEFNPWEMGSWDPTTYGFAPLQYVGSNFSQGILPDDEKCVSGFDNVGYVMGTSSTLFNTFFTQFNQTVDLPSFIQDPIQKALDAIGGRTDEDIATWKPNPFRGFNNATNFNAQTDSLTLVDGGEDLANIPLNPLIQPFRAVDAIFAIDSSADTDSSFPNGTSLLATYQRSQNETLQNGTAFPYIPDQNTFVNLGLNTRPTFFGCNASNFSRPDQVPGPLIVYLPNAPYVYGSGLSTFDPKYNNTQRDAVITNGYDVATQGNGTLDANWPVCVACAMLYRSLERNDEPVPDACQQCFGQYCWNGTVASQPPPAYNPTVKIPQDQIKLTSTAALAAPRAAAVVLGAVLAGMWLLV